MKMIKRYRVFILLLIANIIVGLIAPDIGLKSLDLTVQNFTEMILIIPPIFVLLGLLDVWVDKTTMMKYTGEKAGIKGILIAFLLGSAAAGPLYAAFPIASVMLKKGSSLFNVFVFICAWSTTKIPMMTFESSRLGFNYMITRLILIII
jgi:uncharacterized membrane protein YraQ (UPF0718 family)